MPPKTPDSRAWIDQRQILAVCGFLALAVLWVWLQYGGFSGLLLSVGGDWERHAALTPTFRFEGFFDTSTVPQDILYGDSSNWVVRQEDGRSFLAAANPEQPAIIHVRLRKDFDDYVIFPRVGAGSEIAVGEGTPDTLLFRLRGGTAWTPLGRRYLLNLRCVAGGECRQQIPLDLLVILQGKNAQLWLSDGKVVFR